MNLMGFDTIEINLVFFIFSKNLKKRPFCSVNFSMKIEPTEKMEYTMTKPTENPSKLSSQIFEF